MDDDVHPVQGAHEALAVAHVADEVAQVRLVESHHLHLVLFQLIAAEDDDLLRLFLFQQDLGELLAERACAAGDEDDLVFPVHVYSVLRVACFVIGNW